MNSEVEKQVREKAKALLAEGAVDLVIGWQAGTLPLRGRPLFAHTAEEVEQLMISPLSVHNLAEFLNYYRDTDEKIAIVLKGCDARSVAVLLEQQQFARERLVLLGVNCSGVMDSAKLCAKLKVDEKDVQAVAFAGANVKVTLTSGESKSCKLEDVLADRCKVCYKHNCEFCDEVFGEAVSDPAEPDFSEVEQVDQLSLEERLAKFNAYFDRCIRCYACRNVCPACFCRNCIFDQHNPRWVPLRNELPENQMMLLIRAFHLAGRCVDCGECERACPQNIKIRELNKKLEKEVFELYDWFAGKSLEEPVPLATFNLEDYDPAEEAGH